MPLQNLQGPRGQLKNFRAPSIVENLIRDPHLACIPLTPTALADDTIDPTRRNTAQNTADDSATTAQVEVRRWAHRLPHDPCASERRATRIVLRALADWTSREALAYGVVGEIAGCQCRTRRGR